MHYVAASEEIEREELLKEIGTLETSAQDALIKTSEQRIVVDLSRDASRLKKLLTNEMTPDDWTAYKRRQAEIADLPARLKKIGSNATVRWPENMANFLSPFESFCARAMDRNAALTGRLLEKMAQEKKSVAILIAGGFHTEGLMATLAKQGASVAVLTPKIGQVDPHHRYLDAFAQDPLPLEKIFNGEPISMKIECPLGESSNTGVALRTKIHLGIVLFVLNNLRRRLVSDGKKRGDIKQALADLLEGLKEKVKALSGMSLSIEAVTSEGVSIQTGDSREKYLATAKGDSTEISVAQAPPTLINEILSSPTLREEIRIALKESAGFLSPVIYFWNHPQWVGHQKWIGSLLILGLWLVMGETATAVVNFLSNWDFSFGGFSPPVVYWMVGLVAGFFATLPAHIDWNLFAEKANTIFDQHAIRFRFPRLTVRDETEGGEQDIQRLLALLKDWVSKDNFSMKSSDTLFKLVKKLSPNELKGIIEKLNLSEGDQEKLREKLTAGLGSVLKKDLTLPIFGIKNVFNFKKKAISYINFKTGLVPPSSSPHDDTAPPSNGMEVTNKYIDGINLDDAKRSPLDLAEEALARLKKQFPDSVAELEEMMERIRQLHQEQGLGDVAFLMAGVIDRITRAEPDRFILHFARDMGLTLATQEVLAQMDEAPRNGGALFLNREMMGTVYSDLRDVLSLGLKHGKTQEEAVLDWIQTKANDPANTGFRNLLNETQSSLGRMGVFDREKVLLFDTGLVGTMPWFVWAVIQYTDRQNGRSSRRDVEILLVKSLNGTRQVGLQDIDPSARIGLRHSLLSLLEDNESLLSRLENTGDVGGHPMKTTRSWAGIFVVRTSPANQLLFRYFQAVFVNQALVFRGLETTSIESIQNVLKKITPKIDDYFQSGLTFPLAGSKFDKYLIFAKPEGKTLGSESINLLPLWKNFEGFSNRMEKLNESFKINYATLKPLDLNEKWKWDRSWTLSKAVRWLSTFFKTRFLGTIVFLPLLETMMLQGVRPALENGLSLAGFDPSGGMVILTAGIVFSLIHVLALSFRREKVSETVSAKDVLFWTLGGALFSFLLALDGGFGWSLGIHALLNHGIVHNSLKDIPILGRLLKNVDKPFAVGSDLHLSRPDRPALLTEDRRLRNEAIAEHTKGRRRVLYLAAGFDLSNVLTTFPQAIEVMMVGRNYVEFSADQIITAMQRKDLLAETESYRQHVLDNGYGLTKVVEAQNHQIPILALSLCRWGLIPVRLKRLHVGGRESRSPCPDPMAPFATSRCNSSTPKSGLEFLFRRMSLPWIWGTIISMPST
jgi:hypothetical protein